MLDAILAGIMSGVPFLLAHFCVTILVFVCAAYLYFRITPHNEMALIKQGNVAAALSYSGALLGLALPMAFCLAGSVSVLDIMIWGGIILIIQIISYLFIDRLLFRGLSSRIEKQEMAPAILLFSTKLCVGMINAAAIAI